MINIDINWHYNKDDEIISRINKQSSTNELFGVLVMNQLTIYFRECRDIETFRQQIEKVCSQLHTTWAEKVFLSKKDKS